MMPIMDSNDLMNQTLMRQQSAGEQLDFSWTDLGDLDFVDSILAQSLQSSFNMEDVLKANATSEVTQNQVPLPVPAMTADDISDFLFELENLDQPNTENTNEFQGLAVSRDMFEPIPLSNNDDRFSINSGNCDDDQENLDKFVVPKAGQSWAGQTPIGGTAPHLTNSIHHIFPNSSNAPTPRQRIDEESSSSDEGYSPKFRGYQCDQWEERFNELSEFFKQNGHSSVPHTDSSNRRLARWVKRQRYQYKLRQEGKPSAMTDERIRALEGLGFVWDSHGAAFEDRLRELEEFKARHKHCNVPSNYRANSSLASWVKCQRRQYRLYREGKHSNITQARIDQLEGMGFQFNLRVGYHHHRSSGNGWS
jgi:Helicase associated domain